MVAMLLPLDMVQALKDITARLMAGLVDLLLRATGSLSMVIQAKLAWLYSKEARMLLLPPQMVIVYYTARNQLRFGLATMDLDKPKMDMSASKSSLSLLRRSTLPSPITSFCRLMVMPSFTLGSVSMIPSRSG